MALAADPLLPGWLALPRPEVNRCDLHTISLAKTAAACDAIPRRLVCPRKLGAHSVTPLAKDTSVSAKKNPNTTWKETSRPYITATERPKRNWPLGTQRGGGGGGPPQQKKKKKKQKKHTAHRRRAR